MPQQKLDNALKQLVHAELMFRRGTPPDAEYTFKHVLVQDAAYSTLLRSRRQQLHARVAAALEDCFPEIVLAQPALLAQHCAEAGLAEDAVAYWLKAGHQAIGRSAMTEAVAQLRKGWTRWPDCPIARRSGKKSWTCKSRSDLRWLPLKACRRRRWARPSLGPAL
jgi:predicted ATPase